MYNKFKYDNRFGFAAPFLLGALTGGVAVGAVNQFNNPGYYYPYAYPYYQYPYYY